MKDKILYLIIGAITGAIITTGVFMIIDKNSEDNNQPQRGTFRNFDPSNMPEEFDMNNMQEGVQTREMRRAPVEQ